MNHALLSLAIATQLGTLPVLRVADRVPVIDVEQTCKEAAATDEAMNLALPQSVENCMRDENAARQQIAAVWSNYSASMRDSCTAEATMSGAGTGSYVDLLTCLQMTDPAKLTSTMELKGASKDRNKK